MSKDLFTCIMSPITMLLNNEWKRSIKKTDKRKSLNVEMIKKKPRCCTNGQVLNPDFKTKLIGKLILWTLGVITLNVNISLNHTLIKKHVKLRRKSMKGVIGRPRSRWDRTMRINISRRTRKSKRRMFMRIYELLLV